MQIFYPLNNDLEKTVFFGHIIKLCNINCGYCGATKTNNLMAFIRQETLNVIINKLKNYKEDFGINIMGGEPTLYPNITEIIKRIHELENCKRVYLLTNFKRQDIPGEELKNLEKLSVYCTFHVQFIDNPDDYVERLKLLKENNITHYVKLLYSNKDQLEKGEKYDFVHTTKPIIQISNGCIDEEYLDEPIIYNDEQMTYKDLFERNLHYFKGGTCHNVNKLIGIDPSGNFTVFCTHKHIQDINNIEKFDEVCQKERCDCGALLKLKKGKE